MAKFCIALRSYLHGKGMILMGSSSAGAFSWFAHLLDTVGGEVQGADPLDYAYLRRALSYGKPWSNLFVLPPARDPRPPPKSSPTCARPCCSATSPELTESTGITPPPTNATEASSRQYIPLIQIHHRGRMGTRQLRLLLRSLDAHRTIRPHFGRQPLLHRSELERLDHDDTNHDRWRRPGNPGFVGGDRPGAVERLQSFGEPKRRQHHPVRDSRPG